MRKCRFAKSTEYEESLDKRRIDQLRVDIDVNESFKKKLVRSMFMEKESEMEN